MRSLKSLREYVLARLEIEPEYLSTFVEKGTIRSYASRTNDSNCNPFFRIEYTAILILMESKLSPEAVFFIVDEWLRTNQTGYKSDSISFEVEILDNDRVNMKLDIAGIIDTWRPLDQGSGYNVRPAKNIPADPILRAEGVLSVAMTKVDG